ncbi:MAG: hypothetical protein CFH37_00135 [Alphaproteobacteria bacterium MarineAlpha9_Bin7]|jgi:hypothetical protein|nr:MAG: hypothetical protein CFH37_00135 [Alphaproteobacteria bacterium MarineAlpha9_Bin7]
MSRQATVILALLFAGASLGLYQIKYKIQSLKQDLAGIQDEVWIEQDSVHVLEAEWAYLNRPQRLAQLSDKYLSFLRPVSPSQIVSFDALPLRADREGRSPEIQR